MNIPLAMMRATVNVEDWIYAMKTEFKHVLSDMKVTSNYCTVCVVQVTITPEVRSTILNRMIIAELVRVYRESDLGERLPVFDGGRSLYTAGELPFVCKEFNIKLVDEDDGTERPRYNVLHFELHETVLLFDRFIVFRCVQL